MKLGSLALTCAILCALFASCNGASETGGACYDDDNGVSLECEVDYQCESDVCSPAGICECPPKGEVAIGLACSGDDCVPTATCTNSVCVANSLDCGSVGEPCEIDGDCCNGGVCTYDTCSSASGDGGVGGAGSGGAGGAAGASSASSSSSSGAGGTGGAGGESGTGGAGGSDAGGDAGTGGASGTGGAGGDTGDAGSDAPEDAPSD
jgi:hypothetical protein